MMAARDVAGDFDRRARTLPATRPNQPERGQAAHVKAGED
jgi:hypothetical protein